MKVEVKEVESIKREKKKVEIIKKYIINREWRGKDILKEKKVLKIREREYIIKIKKK